MPVNIKMEPTAALLWARFARFYLMRLQLNGRRYGACVAPREILKRYEKWKDVAILSGPSGLRLIKGFHDEALAEAWCGWRSSRLGLQWRVIYRVASKGLAFYVESLRPYECRRP